MNQIADIEKRTGIKLLVLENLSDIQSLVAVIQASPSLLNLYLATRECLLISITINELLTKKIDILTPAALLEVRVSFTGVPWALQPALKSLYHQLRTGKRALRHLEDIVRWNISLDEEGRECLDYGQLPESRATYWGSHNRYHVIFMGEPRIRTWEFEDRIKPIYEKAVRER